MQTYIYSFNNFIFENTQNFSNMGPVHQVILKKFDDLEISWDLASTDRQLKNGTLLFGLTPLDVLRLIENTKEEKGDFLRGSKRKLYTFINFFYLNSKLHERFTFCQDCQFWWVIYPSSIKRSIDFTTKKEITISSNQEVIWENSSQESVNDALDKILTRTLVNWPLSTLSSIVARNLKDSNFSESDFREVKNPLNLLDWVENDMLRFMEDNRIKDSSIQKSFLINLLEGAPFTSDECNQLAERYTKEEKFSELQAIRKNYNWDGDEWLLGGW